MMAVIILFSLSLSIRRPELLFAQCSTSAGLLKSSPVVLLFQSLLLQFLLRLFQLFLQLFYPPLQLVDGLLHLADMFRVDLL